MIESVAIKFQLVGNRRCLTLLQLQEDRELAAFVNRFAHCFEYDPSRNVLWFKEEE